MDFFLNKLMATSVKYRISNIAADYNCSIETTWNRLAGTFSENAFKISRNVIKKQSLFHAR